MQLNPTHAFSGKKIYIQGSLMPSNYAEDFYPRHVGAMMSAVVAGIFSLAFQLGILVLLFKLNFMFLFYSKPPWLTKKILE